MAISIPIVTEFNGKGIQKAIKEFKQLETVGQKAQFALRKAAIPAAAALGLVAKGMTDAVKSASDLGESVNAVRVTFGDASAEILKLSDAAAESVGLSKKDFNTLSVQFASFATKIAGKSGNVAKVLEKLTGRAADFASVMNIDVSEAAEKFQSGLAGEAEPLKKFGIDISDSAIKAFAYANGIAKAGDKLTEQQKVLARYGAIMEQTDKTAGDFKNTSDGLANSQRIVKAKMDNLKASIGQGLLPVIEKVLPFVQAFADWATENPGTFQAVAAAITAVAVAITAVNIAMALNPFTLIAAGIALVVTGLAIAYTKFEGFRKVVDKVINFIIGAIEKFANGWIDAINLVIRGINIVNPGKDIGSIPKVSLGRITEAYGGTSAADLRGFDSANPGPSMSAPSIATNANRGVIVNITAGVGDPVAIGKSVRQALNAYDRRAS
jgi:hypothetical protein